MTHYNWKDSESFWYPRPPVPIIMFTTPRAPLATTAPLNTSPTLKPLAYALLTALFTWATPSHAAINTLSYTVEADGTPGWDSSDGPGLDKGPKNNIVRTNDEVIYQASISYAGGTKNAKIELTLAKDDQGKPIAEWPATPPNDCAKAGSSVSADRQTLICALSDHTGSGTNSGNFRARVLGSVRNGTMMRPPSIKVSSANTPSISPNNTPPTLTVSAAPFYDVLIQNSFPGNPKAYAFQAAGGPNREDGFYHRMLVGLMARNPYGNGKKGVEQLDPTKPILIDLDVSGYPASARLDNWRTKDNSPSNALPLASYTDGCGSIGTGRPSILAGGTVNPHQRVYDRGPSAVSSSDSAAVVSVTNGGDCEAIPTANGLPDNHIIHLKLVGVDTTLARTPIRYAGSTQTNIPQDEFWVANKAVVLWTNLNDYPAQRTVEHTLKLAKLDASSISGQQVIEGRSENNSFTYQLTNQADGNASKVFSPDETLPLPKGTSRDPGYPGDSIIDYVAHGQHIKTRVGFNNTGSVTFQNLMLCDVIDRTAFDIGSDFSASLDTQVGTPHIQYGVKAGGPYFSTTDSAASPYNGTNSPQGSSEYARDTCEEPSITWYETAQQAESAGKITYIKGTVDSLSGGKGAYLYITGLKLRDTWASTITVQEPTNQVRGQGQEITEGSIIRNKAVIGATNMAPAMKQRLNAYIRDHIEAKKARTTTRIKKTIIDPANANTQRVSAGTVLTYQLQPIYATALPPYKGTVTVTDILPESLQYVKGSGTQGDSPMEPEVEENTPATGLTRLTWKYENQLPHVGGDGDTEAQLPPITFKARLALTLTNGATVRNQAAVSGGDADADADCVFDTASSNYKACAKSAEASVTIDTPPGFVLQKSVSQESIEPGEDFHYDIRFYALGQELRNTDIPDVIDILPFVGDGTNDPSHTFNGRNPASAFDSGAYRLQSVEAPSIDAGMKIYFTKRPPHEINNDARDSSNAIPGGSTHWCTLSEIGTADCPASVGDSTAIRTSPTLALLKSGIPYDIRLNITTDPLIAKAGNILANHAGARPANPSSHLLYAYSDTSLNIHIRTSSLNSLSGRVYIDQDQNGQLDGSQDAGLSNQCVAISGTDKSGKQVNISTRTDAQGQYNFAIKASHAVFENGDCSGTAITSFGGILIGDYSVFRVSDTTTGNLDGASHAGNAGGNANGRRIGDIHLTGGQSASGYDFTETRQLPHITLIAQVNNTHGGTATADSLQLTATGSGSAQGTTLQGNTGSHVITQAEVSAGNYTLDAPSVPGYTNSNWQCVLNGNAPMAGKDLVLTWNDNATCTVVYTDRPAPRLTLISEVINTHGGKATVDTIKLSASQPAGIGSSLNGTSGSSTVTSVSIPPGDWTLDIHELPDYAHGDWSCTVQPGSTKTNGQSITLSYEQEAICRIQYEDMPKAKDARLTLISQVHNRHGGSATTNDITLTGSHTDSDTGAESRISGVSGNDSISHVDVQSGEWKLNAPDLPQYWHGQWKCNINNTRTLRSDTIALQKGESAVCTVRYEDTPPAHLTLVNTVINQQNGTAKAEDFPLSANGPGTLDGRSGAPDVTRVEVPAGKYGLNAQTLPGYVPGPWECRNAHNQALDIRNAEVELQSSDDVICRIQHIDQPLSLTLKLDIINQHGGTAAPSGHAVSAHGPEHIQGITGSKPVTLAPVKPGVYELQNLTLPGYLTGKWLCNGGTLNGNRLTLANLQNVTCQLELKDLPATLKLSKTVQGKAEPVAGTSNDFDVHYIIQVRHESGVAGVYDLVDTPAFDNDVQMLSVNILRNDQPLNISSSQSADGKTQWKLANQQPLSIGAQDTYRLNMRIRVPFDSNAANNQCQSNSPDGHGLYNAASLKHYDEGQVSSDALTAQACTDTPVPTDTATLAIDKSSNSRTVEVGDLITYQLRIRNNGKSTVHLPEVVDRLPRGFRFEAGSVTVQNARATAISMQANRELHILLDGVSPSGTQQGNGSDVQITYRLRAGVGSQEGDGINRAHVQCTGRNATARRQCSNESRWKVRVTGGIFSDEACLAGQIFVDCNGNSVKDTEELGIPGVRLYLENGTWLVSDEQGKYSHCGLRPRTHVLKVDERTLPRHSRLVTSSAQNVGDAHSLFIDAKKGMLHRADFIEGSCSASVIEQVKARQAQGANTSVQTEPGQPALTFDSKQGIPARPRQQGTDGANQPLARTRH